MLVKSDVTYGDIMGSLAENQICDARANVLSGNQSQ